MGSNGPEGVCREVDDNVYNLTVRWDDRTADYLYRLSILTEYENGERFHKNDYSGDKDWAERIAEHYKLKLPEIE